MDLEETVTDLAKRLGVLETAFAAHDAEVKEKWRGQFHLNKETKTAIADLVKALTAVRLKIMLWAGSAAAGGAGAASWISNALAHVPA